MVAVEGMRAFAGEPQPVEVHHRGVWWSGDLLGWRFETDGSCVARVRCVVDGLRHTAWVDLADLRLPERIQRVRPADPLGLDRDRPLLPREAPGSSRTRHRPPDDETQPHLLFTEAFAGRRMPGGLKLPPPRGRRPAVGERLSSV